MNKAPESFFFYKRLLLPVLFSLWAIAAWAQLNYDFTEGKFLIKGTVVDLQSKKPIPMANIRINNTAKGVTCDNDGAFYTYVSKSDTLRVSSTGYITKLVHIREIDSSTYYTLRIELLHDFIKLKEVTIYPYRDMDDFKKAFIEAKDMQRANVYGLIPPKYTNSLPKPKLYNPVSFLYERLKKRKRIADPDFKP